MANDDRLRLVMELSNEAERSIELQARRRRVDRREQLVHGRWDEPRLPGKEYVVDIMPKTMAERAVAKLTGEDDEYAVSAAIDLGESLHIPDEVAAMLNPDQVDDWIATMTEQARKRAGKVSLLCRGLLDVMQSQQGTNLLQSITRGAVVDGFAGPVRFGFDDNAVGEPGVIPLYYQVLDPRGYYEVRGNGASKGPRLVLYKRQTLRGYLEREGWQLRPNSQIKRLAPDAQLTIYDCWEKIVTKGKVKLTHATVAVGSGGNDGEHIREFLKPPADMARFGLTRIPYAWMPVGPMQYVDELYPGGQSTSFVDGFLHNWETRNKLLSWQAQIVHKAVNPPTVQATREFVEVDAVTPGAQNQVAPGESIETLGTGEALREIAQAWSMLEAMTQRGTFSAVSFGEAARSLSGLQTGRLQSSSEESLVTYRLAIQGALNQCYEILAMLARIFLRDGQYAIPIQAGLQLPLAVELIPETVVFDCKLPMLSRVEHVQLAGQWKTLADPRPNGSRFISDETGREMAYIPNATNEDERTRRELYHELIVDQVRQMQAKRDAERQENVEDMQAQAQTQMLIQSGQQTGGLGHPAGVSGRPIAGRQATPEEGQGYPQRPDGGRDTTGGMR